MPFAVLTIDTGLQIPRTGSRSMTQFQLSAPNELLDRIHETMKHQNIRAAWNDCVCNCRDHDIRVRNLLNWIEASGWELVQMSSTSCREHYMVHTYVFKKL